MLESCLCCRHVVSVAWLTTWVLEILTAGAILAGFTQRASDTPKNAACVHQVQEIYAGVAFGLALLKCIAEKAK